MLVKFTIDGGTAPVTQQAREEVLDDRLRILAGFDPDAEGNARNAIRTYLKTHTEFTAAHIACTGNGDEWHADFEPLYSCLAAATASPSDAHEEAARRLMARWGKTPR